MRLDDAVTYFLDGWPAEGPSPRTVRTYQAQLTWLCGFVARRRKPNLSDLTPELLRAAMVAKLQERGQRSKGNESSAYSLAFAARCLVRWLAAQGVPVASDLRNVHPRRPPERIQPRLYPPEFDMLEQAILHRLVERRAYHPRAMVARDLALIHLLAETGLRASEVCAMDVRHIDFQRGAVIVLRGKGNKERAISILDAGADDGVGTALQLLAEWISVRETIGWTARHSMLWTSIKGRPLTDGELRRILNRICTDAGLSENRPPHAFRRFHFTEAYKAHPEQARVLAERMGWSPRSVQMLNTYTRGVEIDLARTVALPSVVGGWRNTGRGLPPAAGERTMTMPSQAGFRPLVVGGVGSSGEQSERPGRGLPQRESREPGRVPRSPRRAGTSNPNP